jgi:hypothetical protein
LPGRVLAPLESSLQSSVAGPDPDQLPLDPTLFENYY